MKAHMSYEASYVCVAADLFTKCVCVVNPLTKAKTFRHEGLPGDSSA